jgi:Domain of unknown function (DUF4129)
VATVAAWAAAGAAVRMLHDAPLPPQPGRSPGELAARLAGECEWLAAGYGTDLDRDLIHAWQSLRCLTNVRWLAEHGYGSPDEFPEVAVLRSRP